MLHEKLWILTPSWREKTRPLKNKNRTGAYTLLLALSPPISIWNRAREVKAWPIGGKMLWRKMCLGRGRCANSSVLAWVNVVVRRHPLPLLIPGTLSQTQNLSLHYHHGPRSSTWEIHIKYAHMARQICDFEVPLVYIKSPRPTRLHSKTLP